MPHRPPRPGVETVATLLEVAAAASPDAPALVHGADRLDYAALNGRVADMGDGLAALRLPPGSRVLLWQDKSVALVVALLAVMRAGHVAVPANPRLKPAQVAHIVRDCTPALVLAGAYRARLLDGVLPADIPVIETVPAADAGTTPRAPVIDEDPAIIFYTSGSTGAPKGVVASHRNLVAGALSVNVYLGTAADDVVLAALPLSFDAGFSQITTAIAAGACVVLHEFLRPAALVRDCARHGVTAITAIPPLWSQIAEADWPPEAAGAIRRFANTGGHMPRALLQRLRTLFPAADPFLMYGLTEAFRSTYLDPAEIDRRPGSMGRAIPNADVRVLRPDGTECDADEPGELVHRGAHVTLGYWNDAARTAERFRPAPAFDGGFPRPAVWSGDIVRRDADGFLYFVGRRDEQIKTSGYRVSPTEIEAALLDHPGVREAVAFGLPDAVLGQRIHAAVAPAEATGAALDAYLRRVLPGYMVPVIWPHDALPRTAVGKLDRNGIKAAAAAWMEDARGEG